LRALLNGADQVINENAKEISKLDKAAAQLGGVIGEKDKEIRGLRHASGRDGALIEQQVNDIEDLQGKIKTFELVCDAKANKIKDLEGALKIVRHLRSENVHENGQLRQELATSRDYSDKQADVIRNYLKQIADLERRLELSEKFSGNKEFHNATEAMGNPQYFQGVSND
jgi:chromosome segregation ATPase